MSADNIKGYGTPSPLLSSGAMLRTIPTYMNDPIKGSQTTDLQIQVSWAPITGSLTGNSNILSYNLYWDNGSGNINLMLTDSLVTSFIVTGVTGG